jgi:hypothetical protein
MPRLSLYKPEKGNDYKFLDRSISEMFQVGGTDIYLHKYLGPKNPSQADATADQPLYTDGDGNPIVKETNIQDLLFLENRDRTYDSSIYTLRGIYNVADIDFNLSQFGLFIDQDTVFMTVHINDFIQSIGRKPLAGDVIELPHLRDEFALNDFDVALPRYFVIDEVGRAAEGFSRTWYPHLYRLKLKKIVDSQQYKEIFDQKIVNPVTGVETATSLRDVLSTYNKQLSINDSILAQAEADAPKSGYETRQFYTLALDENGNPALKTADETDVDASSMILDASEVSEKAKRSGYTGYLLGDGVPPNGADFGFGIQFPSNAIKDDYFLRNDMMPNRLFRYDGRRWVKVEDAVRHTLSNTDTRNTQRTGFINNTKSTVIGTETVQERQSISKALKPKADF